MTSEPTQGADKAKKVLAGDAQAARRYALAAYEIAKESSTQEEWRNALVQIAEFMGDREVRAVLENRRVSQEPKQTLIDAALGDLPAMPLNLARLLVRKSRTGLAGAILQAFDLMLEQERGIVRAQARSAVPLSDAEKEVLAQRIESETGNRVILDVEVDPELLGGIVVQIGDKLIDASTRSRLQAMRESLIGAI